MIIVDISLEGRTLMVLNDPVQQRPGPDGGGCRDYEGGGGDRESGWLEGSALMNGSSLLSLVSMADMVG